MYLQAYLCISGFQIGIKFWCWTHIKFLRIIVFRARIWNHSFLCWRSVLKCLSFLMGRRLPIWGILKCSSCCFSVLVALERDSLTWLPNVLLVWHPYYLSSKASTSLTWLTFELFWMGHRWQLWKEVYCGLELSLWSQIHELGDIGKCQFFSSLKWG